VTRLGTSSVRYEVGLFKEGSDEAAAHGHFVHVYVDRVTRRPVSLPDALREALEPIRVVTGTAAD
jgi:acyl-CoA thioester hydrolase